MAASTRARALLTEAVPLLEPLLTTVSVGVVVVDVMTEGESDPVNGGGRRRRHRGDDPVLNHRKDGAAFCPGPMPR